MKLGATITSERGKPVTKTGNDYITVQIKNEREEIVCTLHIEDGGKNDEWKDGCTIVTANYERNRTMVRKIPWDNLKANESLKRDRTCLRCGDKLQHGDDLICGYHHMEE